MSVRDRLPKDKQKAAGILPPNTTEEFYRNVMWERLELVRERLEKELDDLLLTIGPEIEDRAREDSKKGNIRSINVVVKSLSAKLSTRKNEAALRKAVEEAARRTNVLNHAVISEGISAEIGAQVLIPARSSTRDLTKQFAAENLKKVKGLEDEFLASVSESLTDVVRKNKPRTELIDALEKEFQGSRRKAELIARDQIHSLNAKLTKERHQSLGIGRYRWITMNDERVRPEHEERDGEIFEWNNPPFDGHPGEPINCRCQAAPITEDILGG